MGPMPIDTLVSRRLGVLTAPGAPKRLADIGSLAGGQMASDLPEPKRLRGPTLDEALDLDPQ
eukprot:6409813-Alexandrium_andersonii.AAC.1